MAAPMTIRATELGSGIAKSENWIESISQSLGARAGIWDKAENFSSRVWPANAATSPAKKEALAVFDMIESWIGWPARDTWSGAEPLLPRTGWIGNWPVLTRPG